MLKFIYKIEQIFELEDNDYFCLINDYEEVHEELIEVVENILEQNNLKYLITTLKYDNIDYKPTREMFPIKLKYYNNIHGLIIKKKNINTLEDLNNIVLKINNNFVPFEFIEPKGKMILLNNNIDINITRLKDIKILISYIVYDNIESYNYSVETKNISVTIEKINKLISYIHKNKEEILEIIKNRDLDDTLLYGLFSLSGVNIEDIYLQEKTKIIKSSNKDIIFKGKNG